MSILNDHYLKLIAREHEETSFVSNQVRARRGVPGARHLRECTSIARKRRNESRINLKEKAYEPGALSWVKHYLQEDISPLFREYRSLAQAVRAKIDTRIAESCATPKWYGSTQF